MDARLLKRDRQWKRSKIIEGLRSARPVGLERKSRPLLGDYSSISAGPDWTGYVPMRLKTMRAVALNGTSSYSGEFLEVPKAVAVLELSGGRTGRYSTALWVGFSLAVESELPPPTFLLGDNTATGSLVLPAMLLSPWLQLLGQPSYFRIGGDGRGNAISSDMSFWD